MKSLNIIKYTFAIIGTGMLMVAFSMYKNSSQFIGESIEAGAEMEELLKSSNNSSDFVGAMIIGVIGLVFFIIGGSIIAYGIRKKNILKKLKQNGMKIEADFQNVSVNTSLAVNGEHPFVIISQWQNPKTSELHIFKSDNIWFDPTDFIKTDKINVLIDRENLKRYSVDLSFLPKVAK